LEVGIRELIEDAARKEDEARAFYLKLKEAAHDPSARKLLSDLAAEEAHHAEVLRGGDVNAFLETRPPAIQDLRITEFLAPKRLTPDASFQDVLIHAMKREDASFWAYQALAESAKDDTTRRLFRRLAEEERGHRNKLEKLYDDVIFTED
jgi:rubrerythrin